MKAFKVALLGVAIGLTVGGILTVLWYLKEWL